MEHKRENEEYSKPSSPFVGTAKCSYHGGNSMSLFTIRFIPVTNDVVFNFDMVQVILIKFLPIVNTSLLKNKDD